MKKLFAIAAAAALLGIVTPAAAQSINVRIGNGGYHHPHRAYGYHARPKVVVVPRRHVNRGYHHGLRNANRVTVVIAR